MRRRLLCLVGRHRWWPLQIGYRAVDGAAVYRCIHCDGWSAR